MISIVCVYNNKKILDNYLLKSLKNQTIKYELILIDNSKNKFESAVKALNYGWKKTRGKYLMFVHQDVNLKSCDWLETVEKTLDSLENLGIAGVAGMSETENGIISNIEHGNPPKPAGKIHITHPVHVQTLDECLFIIPRFVFKEYKLDMSLEGWHLYAVEYCLKVKKNGLNVYVIPNSVYHSSYEYGLSLPKNYYKILKTILKKYQKDYNKIYTTCGIWNTTYPLFIQKINLSIRMWLGRMLIKILNQ